MRLALLPTLAILVVLTLPGRARAYVPELHDRIEATHAGGPQLAMLQMPQRELADTMRAEIPAPAAPSSSSVGSAIIGFILAHLTEGTIIAILGYIGGRFLSRERERQVATAIFYAAHMAADIDIELAPGGAKSTADKIAAYLKAADDYCLSHGWRALKPGEQLAAATKAQAIVGAGKISAGGDVPALDPSKAPAAA